MVEVVEQLWKGLSSPENDMLEIKSVSGYKEDIVWRVPLKLWQNRKFKGKHHVRKDWKRTECRTKGYGRGNS